MTTTEVLLLITAIIPIAGNLLALILRRYGHHAAAEKVDQLTPIAARLGTSKSREDAIASAVELLTVAAVELGPEHPVSQATPGIRAELQPRKASSVPPIAPLLPVIAFVLLAGCAGGVGQFQRFVDTTVDAVPVIDDALHGAYDRELDACATVQCVDDVQAEWRPVFQVMAGIRDAWCAVAPDAEGC